MRGANGLVVGTAVTEEAAVCIAKARKYRQPFVVAPPSTAVRAGIYN